MNNNLPIARYARPVICYDNILYAMLCAIIMLLPLFDVYVRVCVFFFFVSHVRL